MSQEPPSIAPLYQSCHRQLLWFLTRLLKCEHAAEEVSQEACLRFHLAAQETAVEQHRAYLFKIAKNIALDRLSKRKTELRYLEPDAGDARIESAVCAAPLPDQVLAARKRYEAMADALNELPKSCREAFVMNKFDGLSYRQIAERLGVSSSMVEKHIARAMSHCRQRLREHDR